MHVRATFPSKTDRWTVLVFLAIFITFSTGHALAHDLGLSTATIKLFTNHIEAVLGFAVADAAEIVELDKDHNGKISKEELKRGTAELTKTAQAALEVTFNDQPASITATRCEFDENNNASGDFDIFPNGGTARFNSKSGQEP